MDQRRLAFASAGGRTAASTTSGSHRGLGAGRLGDACSLRFKRRDRAAGARRRLPRLARAQSRARAPRRALSNQRKSLTWDGIANFRGAPGRAGRLLLRALHDAQGRQALRHAPRRPAPRQPRAFLAATGPLPARHAAACSASSSSSARSSAAAGRARWRPRTASPRTPGSRSRSCAARRSSSASRQSSRRAKRTYRVRLPSRRRRAGDYRVRLRAVGADGNVTSSLTARRL